ncbi:hypothetical protein [Treponema primitia]|nr:hypothetical protein [Treponema primitia]
MVFKGNAYDRAKVVCERLRDEITRQQFRIAEDQGRVGTR